MGNALCCRCGFPAPRFPFSPRVVWVEPSCSVELLPRSCGSFASRERSGLEKSGWELKVGSSPKIPEGLSCPRDLPGAAELLSAPRSRSHPLFLYQLCFGDEFPWNFGLFG